MINFCKLFIKLITEFITQQTMARSIYREFFHKLKYVNFTTIAPISDHLLNFLHYNLGITTHWLIAQHRHKHFKLLIFFMRWRIKNHTLSKNRRHYFIGLTLIQLSIRRPKKGFIRFRTCH